MKHSILTVADNSGALKVMCIHVNGANGLAKASTGSVIVVSIKSCSPNNGKVKKGDVCKAVVVRVKKIKTMANGVGVYFDDNAVVLIDNNYEPMGTRVMGPVDKIVKDVSPRIASLASEAF